MPFDVERHDMNALQARRDEPAKVFIVDDHPVVRNGLEAMLRDEDDLSLCGAAGTLREARRGIDEAEPDVALIDLSLPDGVGTDLIRDLRDADHLRLLVLSSHDPASHAPRAMAAGADGFLSKQEAPETIVQAIRAVLSGKTFVSGGVNDDDAADPPG